MFFQVGSALMGGMLSRPVESNMLLAGVLGRESMAPSKHGG
jgi:hypothetical protein